MQRNDRTGRGVRVGVAVWALVLMLAPPAAGEEPLVAVPRATIYPGDAISAAMVEQRPLARGSNGQGVATLEQAVGKVTRRTLLPGQAIPLAALRLPDVVSSGKRVSLVYAAGDLVISAQGLAMQSGAAGDTVAVQNVDSLAIVRGKVQPDGTVRIED